MHQRHLPMIMESSPSAGHSLPSDRALADHALIIPTPPASSSTIQLPATHHRFLTPRLGEQLPPVIVEMGRSSKSRILYRELEEVRGQSPSVRRAALVEELAALLAPAFAVRGGLDLEPLREGRAQ